MASVSGKAGEETLRSRFLGGMSHAACTVNIITTDGPCGRAGVTVSAMSSVSAETPHPTLLVCIHHLSPAAEAIMGNGVFCVNVLKDSQAYISDAFAGRFRDELADKFACAEWAAMPSGAPRVVDPLVGFDCKVASSERVGAHHVLFGEVHEIFIAGHGSPLVYANRAYGATSRIESASSVAASGHWDDAILRVGCFQTFGPYLLPGIIGSMAARDQEGVRLDLIEGDQRRVAEALNTGEAEVALLYDLDLPGGLDVVPLTRLEPYVLLAEGHPLASQASITPAELAEQPMVLLNVHPSRDYFPGIMRANGHEPLIAFRSTSFEMIRGMVGHGLGYALLATKPATNMTYDGRALICRPLAAKALPASSVVLARRRGVALSPVAERFMWSCHNFFGIEH